MIDYGGYTVPAIQRLTAQPPGYQPCSNYRYFVASEGVEPYLQEPKSCVRPSH